MHPVAETPVTRHRLTVDDYYRMAEAGILHEDDRVELIEEEIIGLAPIESSHAGMVARLTKLLIEAVGDAAKVFSRSPVRLAPIPNPSPTSLCCARGRTTTLPAIPSRRACCSSSR